MKVGFTGTQRGMTVAQRATVAGLLARLPVIQSVHHGDCIGADAEFHDIACMRGLRIVVHPPEIDAKRAFVTGAHETRTPKPYLIRNADIVTEADVLIAAPKEAHDVLRSGTWATIRRARQAGKRVEIVFPDGRMAHERGAHS